MANKLTTLLVKTTEILQMCEYTNFVNIQDRLKGADLSPFQAKIVDINLAALSQNLSHQLYMAAVESQDPKVFEAVKLIAHKMGVDLDVERLSLLVKGK